MANRAGPQPAKVFPNFPYERKFTREEIHGDILPRAQRLGDAMRDGVAPSGHTLFIPGDMFEMWMIHAALAGCDVDEAKAYIRPRKLPDQAGRFADAVEWVVIKEDSEEARAEDAEREADAAIALMQQQLRPEVREAIRRKLRAASEEAAEYLGDDPNGKARRADPRDFGAPKLMHYDDQEPT